MDKIIRLFLVLSFLGVSPSLALGPQASVPSLKVINDFKQPEDVIHYYCSRDAAGFVWAGMLDVERRAFTLWEEVPVQDSFYIAKKYSIKTLNKAEKTAQIEVAYDLLSMGDIHGTRIPVKQPQLKVIFELKNMNGFWKISRPTPENLSPVVMEQFYAGLFEPGALGTVRGLARRN